MMYNTRKVQITTRVIGLQSLALYTYIHDPYNHGANRSVAFEARKLGDSKSSWTQDAVLHTAVPIGGVVADEIAEHIARARSPTQHSVVHCPGTTFLGWWSFVVIRSRSGDGGKAGQRPTETGRFATPLRGRASLRSNAETRPSETGGVR
ncbi:hypothetical protein BU23DRAFT_298692 [Bimuria novae-zelandiae CBS 107.79]|uniref:Uncharacterized protein n=1 Tax=Bimuria novae-zelandiae CBS 107.79 TaxID=1447943 RepID=A0A6A5VJV2_9PLEO|nr:hypothetical protein BU23DRAFT_298692 [Bimuria novae-zelandiae CBS 107.79]